jgi:serine/threonine-protein kinase
VSGALANSSQHGSLTGTLAYMAPEQLEGKDTSPATDLYAVGIVMFEMLSGRLPFEGEQPLGAAIQRLVTAAPPLRDRLPGADPRCEALIAHCLERDPARRPASIDDLARALREGPVPVHRPEAPDRPLAPALAVAQAAPRAPRARWVGWGMGAGVLAAIAIGFFRPSPPPRPSRALIEKPPAPRAPAASSSRPEERASEAKTPGLPAPTGQGAAAAASSAQAQTRTQPRPTPARTAGDRPGGPRRLVASTPSRRAPPPDPEPPASGNTADSLGPPAVPRSRDPVDGFIFPSAPATGGAATTP